MTNVFISHASQDDPFVKTLRTALESFGLKVWADSRQLRPGDQLAAEIKRAIVQSEAFIVVASKHSIQSEWVIEEVRHALDIQSERGTEQFRIIPILLDGFSRGGLKNWFKEELLDIAASSAPGGLQESLPALLTALGLRLPDDPQSAAQPPEPPVNEFLLVLKNPALYTEEGKRRGMAVARLELHPADGSPAVESEDFEFISPLGFDEAEKLKDYLENYPRYPFLEKILPKVAEVERQIPLWGKSLLDAITPGENTRDILREWLAAPADHERRFSIKIDAAPPKNLPDDSRGDYFEATGILLSIPWEILHDGRGFLFQGQRPVRVKRMLPNRHKKEAMPLQDVLRILLVVPRPEDEQASLIDHRAAARALLQAVDQLGDLAELDILETPTFPALSAKIREASKAGKPFSVVHFDGHGVFDRDRGLGVLCFESHEAREQAKTEDRATALVDATELATELRELRIPLFFLDACQSAMTDHDPSASVAATLLENGVASVAAMSHSVLVTAAEKFAATFYQRLAEGALIGSAMLAGQQSLHADPVRMDLPDGEKLRLHDWFVPVLFQEKNDTQLVRKIPSRAAREVNEDLRKIKRGDTPDAPVHGFVGRDRELLRLERLLLREPWVVLVGQGGAGKTTLAAEFARWMFDTRRFGRLAFVRFEFLSDTRAALDALGKQLVAPDFSVATFENEEKAMLLLDRALRDSPTLIVLDNLETVLPDAEGKQAPGMEAADRFTAFFQRLLKSSDRTRLLLTTRERMPAPFHRGDREVRLGALAPQDALRLIAEVMKTEDIAVPSLNPEDLDAQFGALARTANYHARALTLLTRALAERGGDLPGLNADLSHLMAEMERQHPCDKENSLFASIELSLRRLPEGMREVVDALAVFHGGTDLVSWATIAGRKPKEIILIASALAQVGLAEIILKEFPYYLRLDSALPAYLSTQIAPNMIEAWNAGWRNAMLEFTEFIYQQMLQGTQLAANLSRFAEPNLLSLLACLDELIEPEQVVNLAVKIESLFSNIDRPQAFAFARQTRERAGAKLIEWNNAQFNMKSAEIDRLLEQGNFQSARQLAQQVLLQCQATDAKTYPEAEFNYARAHLKLAKVLNRAGWSEQALPLLKKASEQFLQLGEKGDEVSERMAYVCISEMGICLDDLGQYDEAANMHETSIQFAEKRNFQRDVAAGKNQLANVRIEQERFAQALDLYWEAKSIFVQLGEPGSVATTLHQIGMLLFKVGDHEAAEKAYLEALEIRIKFKIRAEEAKSLSQLGILYSTTDRLEDAVLMFERAAKVSSDIGDIRFEGSARNNLAVPLIQLHRYPEARIHLQRAIECKSQLGHAAELWTTWEILYDLEIAEGNPVAAIEARQKAMQTYESYRREKGECKSSQFPLIAASAQAFQEGQSEELAKYFKTLFTLDLPLFAVVFLRQLIAILHGSRDPALADDPELDYMDAVELRLLLEQLRREGI